MSASADSVSGVASAINLALTPVFLLSGIAGLLVVMTGRLGRVIDRGRALTGHEASASAEELVAIHHELRDLERRRHFASMAIVGSTLSALLTCLLICTLFVEVIVDASLGWLIAVLFTAAALALLFGLVSFLREVHLATSTVRIRAHH